jgi:hypothetical protein
VSSSWQSPHPCPVYFPDEPWPLILSIMGSNIAFYWFKNNPKFFLSGNSPISQSLLTRGADKTIPRGEDRPGSVYLPCTCSRCRYSPRSSHSKPKYRLGSTSVNTPGKTGGISGSPSPGRFPRSPQYTHFEYGTSGLTCGVFRSSPTSRSWP